MLRQLGIAEEAEHVNPNGGAIALGHPLGMSGARIAGTARAGASTSQRALRSGHPVHRRRPRHGGRAGAGLTVASATPSDPIIDSPLRSGERDDHTLEEAQHAASLGHAVGG
ncbi:hypothetical protein [Mesorhizobium shangrilense]|uniref:Thiolase C-terminal domain-containing protein n=1 Tax=Mesorhizobium shangrilense TaxID=460060 RepID=A0ABV2DR10_9HYPH